MGRNKTANSNSTMWPVVEPARCMNVTDCLVVLRVVVVSWWLVWCSATQRRTVVVCSRKISRQAGQCASWWWRTQTSSPTPPPSYSRSSTTTPAESSASTPKEFYRLWLSSASNHRTRTTCKSEFTTTDLRLCSPTPGSRSRWVSLALLQVTVDSVTQHRFVNYSVLIDYSSGRKHNASNSVSANFQPHNLVNSSIGICVALQSHLCLVFLFFFY